MRERILFGIYLSWAIVCRRIHVQNLTTKVENDYGLKGERMRSVTMYCSRHMLNTNIQMEHVSNVKTYQKKKPNWIIFFSSEMLKSSCSFWFLYSKTSFFKNVILGFIAAGWSWNCVSSKVCRSWDLSTKVSTLKY